MNPEQCDNALAALQPLDGAFLLTDDERVALKIVREALASIGRGENLEPPLEGEPLKYRLLRRLNVQFFHHDAPRAPRAVQTPPGIAPAAPVVVPLLAFLLLFLGSVFGANGASIIRATVSITTPPLGNTNTITLAGSTRTITNDVTSSPSTLIQQTNSLAYTATNLANHFTFSPASTAHYISQSSASNFTVRGIVDEPLAITIVGGWATVTYTTNTVTSPVFMVRMPITVEAPTNQVTIAGYLAQALEQSTHSIASNAAALANFLHKGAGPRQYVLSEVQFNSLLVAAGYAQLTNANLVNSTNRGYVISLIDGYYTNSILDRPRFTNAQFSGSTTFSGSSLEAIGSGVNNFISMTATSTIAAVGPIFVLSRENGIATAVDAGDVLGVIGFRGYGTTGQQVGARIRAIPVETFTDSTAAAVLLLETTPTGSTQPIGRLHIASDGTVTITNVLNALGGLNVTGALTAGTHSNVHVTGTNRFDGAINFTRTNVTTLANGVNLVDPALKTYLKVSGPSGAYSIDKVTGGYDGRELVIQKTDSLTLTIVNESGSGGGASTDRILTGTGGNITVTNNPGFVELLYDVDAQRWGVKSKSN